LRLDGELEKAVESVIPNGSEINREPDQANDDQVFDDATLPREPSGQLAEKCQDVPSSRAFSS
jgi:hypothetical protein